MRIRKGIFAVTYKKVGDYYYFAVLKRILHWSGWEIVKGGLEEGEDYETCVKREVKEELNITDILRLERLDGIQSWNYTLDKEKIKTEFVAFLVEVPSESKVDTSKNPTKEHAQGFFLNFRDASAILQFQNQRDLIKQAHKKLKSS